MKTKPWSENKYDNNFKSCDINISGVSSVKFWEGGTLNEHMNAITSFLAEGLFTLLNVTFRGNVQLNVIHKQIDMLMFDLDHELKC